MKNQTLNRYLIFLITSTLAFSQAVTVKGLVKDSGNKKPLVGANVYITGTGMGTSTSDEGRYNIANVSPGTYTLKASYIGYESEEMEITVVAGEELEQDFELNYVTIEGKTVEVTAQARGQMDAINKQLKAKSIKNIISSDRIQELPDANAAEAVARVPGVSIRREGGEGNKVVIRGLSPKYNKITVNGTNLASTDADDRSTDLSMISQYMLEGIEVTKAGTPDQEADVLGGTVNFKLKKAPSGLHGNLVTQGMYNSLKKTQDDYKLVFDISNRFFGDRLGLLGQIDLENRNRSSHNLAANYVNTPADLDTINPLTLETLTLKDVSRQNNRDNNLFVIDYNIPNGNISYSGLHSTINKDITTYANVYPLQTPDGQRNFDTGELLNRIKVTSETWKYEQQLSPDLKLDLFKSFSKSTNGDTNKVYNFRETAAYTGDVSNKSVDNIQEFTVNDTNTTWFERYDYNEFLTTETEHAFGGNMEFDLKLNNQISGKVKFGFKNRDKTREHDRDYEYGAFTYVAHVGKRNETYEMFDWLNNVPQNTIYANYYPFMDKSYDDDGFLDDQYSLGPFADLDKMNQLFSFFRSNWNWDPYHENIMHHFHKTQSLIYDYSGTEEYNARYVMTDLNIGRKLNLVTGVRLEDNITKYKNEYLPH